MRLTLLPALAIVVAPLAAAQTGVNASSDQGAADTLAAAREATASPADTVPS